jgi:hypothetical protein
VRAAVGRVRHRDAERGKQRKATQRCAVHPNPPAPIVVWSRRVDCARLWRGEFSVRLRNRLSLALRNRLTRALTNTLAVALTNTLADWLRRAPGRAFPLAAEDVAAHAAYPPLVVPCR